MSNNGQFHLDQKLPFLNQYQNNWARCTFTLLSPTTVALAQDRIGFAQCINRTQTGMGTTGGIRNYSSLSTGRPKIEKATALSKMDIWKYKTPRGHLTIHLDPWTSFLWAVVPSSMARWDTNSSNSNFAKSTEACKLNHYGRVTFNLKEKLILEGNAEGPRPLKALPPVIWGGYIGFEKLVYLWSLCEKRTINTHEKFRGKWKMD